MNYVKYKNFFKVSFILITSFFIMVYDSKKASKRDDFLPFTLNSYFQGTMHGLFSFILNVTKTVNEYKNYKKKIEFCKKKIQHLEIVSQNIQALRQENAKLKEQLSFYSSNTNDFIPAEIIYLNYSNISSLMEVNKGYNDGVKKDMIAIAYQDGFGGLVGRVVKVYYSTSKILLLTNQDSFISARIKNNRFIGLIEGQGDKKLLQMNYVNKLAEKDLRIGDFIVTAGFGEYPAGIYIGKIKSFKVIGYSSLLSIEVDPLITFDKLEYIFLIKGNERQVGK